MVVVQVHLLSLACNLLDTVVISTIQMLHFSHEFVSLGPQTVEDHSNVVAVGGVNRVLSLEAIDFVKYFLNAVMSME